MYQLTAEHNISQVLPFNSNTRTSSYNSIVMTERKYAGLMMARIRRLMLSFSSFKFSGFYCLLNITLLLFVYHAFAVCLSRFYHLFITLLLFAYHAFAVCLTSRFYCLPNITLLLFAISDLWTGTSSRLCLSTFVMLFTFLIYFAEKMA